MSPLLMPFAPLPESPNVLFDSLGAGYTGQGAPLWTHDISGNCLVIWMEAQSQTLTSTPPTLTVGSTTATNAGWWHYLVSSISWYSYIACWYLLNPPQGFQTLSTTALAGVSPSAGNQYNSVSYFNVSSVGTAVNTTGTGTSLSHSVSGLDGHGRYSNSIVGLGSGSFSAYNQNQILFWPWSNGAPAWTNTQIIGDAAGNGSTVSFTATYSVSPEYVWQSSVLPLLSAV